MRNGGAKRAAINVQDGVLFQYLKEETPLAFDLVTGRTFVGTIYRFDRFSIVVRIKEGEVLLYKHAIACILAASTTKQVKAPSQRRPELRRPRRVACH